MANCDCITALQTPTQAPGKQKGDHQFLFQGLVLNLGAGTSHHSPVLYALRNTPSGRRVVSNSWLEVKFCPLCGTPVQPEETTPV